MKYRKLYEVLDQRRNHNPNFRYTDYSGWKERPQTYLTLARPLWIIAEDHGTGYRFWITQSSRDMQVSYAKMTAKGNGPNLAYCRQCKKSPNWLSSYPASLRSWMLLQPHERKGVPMSLLEKFDAVVVQADNRISETDKYFCETHQEAYEAALTSFKELGFFWEDMLKTQSDLLGPRHTDFFYDYLSSSKGPSISNHSIQAHIKSLHGEFIQTLVHHFNSAYHVTVSSSDVKKALLPEEPDSYRRGNEEEWDAYDEAMQTLTVKYADVVDQVILRLDGRNFIEQAFYELKTSCHKAAWNTYKQEPDFERKKDTIRFTGYGCSYDTWSNVTRWELSDSMKSILRGAAHFETGGYNMYPVGLSDLVGYGRIDHDLVLFPSCTKLKHLKMFKNRRVDIKFASETLAKEFIDTYLGTVC